MFDLLSFLKPQHLDFDWLDSDQAEAVPVEMVHDEETRSSWVFVMPMGETWVWSNKRKTWTELNVTEEFAGIIVQEMQRYIKDLEAMAPTGGRVAYPPIKKEHANGGRRFGDIIKSAIFGEDDWRGIYLHVVWEDDVWPDVYSGKYQFVSPSLVGRYLAENGEEYGPIIDETSLVDNPRFKRIGSVQDTFHLQFNDSQGADMTPEELRAMLREEIDAALDARGIGPGEDPDMGDEEEDVDTMDDPEEEDIDAGDNPDGDDADEPESFDMNDIGRMLVEQKKELAAQKKELAALRSQQNKVGKLNFSEPGSPGTTRKPKKSTKSDRIQAAKKQGLKGKDAVIAARNARAKK